MLPEVKKIDKRDKVSTRRRSSNLKRRLGVPGALKAVREHCLWCNCESYLAVKGCLCTNCPLWAYRFGRNPLEKDLRVAVWDDKQDKIVDWTEWKGYRKKHW